MRPWGPGHRGPVRRLTIAMTDMLPSTELKASATQITCFSVLNNPGHTHRYRRFAPTLTGGHARLAEICTWFQFHNTGLSPAISGQLAWRTSSASTPALPLLIHRVCGLWMENTFSACGIFSPKRMRRLI